MIMVMGIEFESEITGFAIGVVIGSMLFKDFQSIVVPYIKLSARSDRFFGDPEVPIEIAGKRIHARLDTGNGGGLMLLKSTADYLEISHLFPPIKTPSYDPFQNLLYPPSYNIPLTLIGSENIPVVFAPTMLAEDVNPHLDNGIIPAWLFLQRFGISFHPHYAEFTPHPVIRPWAVSVPRLKKGKLGSEKGYAKLPLIVVYINGRLIKVLLDSAGAADMISHTSTKSCGLHSFPKAEVFRTTDARGTLILQGYKGVPAVVPGLPPIFTEIYETIPNGIYNDVDDGLTTELFIRNGYIVTVTDTEVLFERFSGW
jgi:hypothetical protein